MLLVLNAAEARVDILLGSLPATHDAAQSTTHAPSAPMHNPPDADAMAAGTPHTVTATAASMAAPFAETAPPLGGARDAATVDAVRNAGNAGTVGNMGNARDAGDAKTVGVASAVPSTPVAGAALSVTSLSSSFVALHFDTPTRGTEVLAPALRDLLRQQGRTAADITHIACVAGPGSFTGVRLTLTTAAALRRVHHSAVAGCNFLHCLAVMGQRLAPHAPQYWVVTHARRNLVHVQGFVATEGERAAAATASATTKGTVALVSASVAAAKPVGHSEAAAASISLRTAATAACDEDAAPASAVSASASGFSVSSPAARPLPVPLTDILLISPADAATLLGKAPRGSLLLGTGLERNPQIHEQNPHCILAQSTQPEATDLWRAAVHADYTHTDIAPLYVRPCDAIDNLSHIAATQGMDPTYAHTRLGELLAAPVHEAE